MATPKRCPPVRRLPTNNPKSTPKLLMKTVSKPDPEDSPLSEPELTLPPLPSISHLCTYLMELNVPATPPSPLYGRNAEAGGILREAESINIENLLQRGDVDTANLLDVELSGADDLILE
ncbi:hypothetical protein M378DRAFT_12694 [Amanita muscaria Koide BX008]|uniref:Uncharacterized protein n=1 Tax=Amanita muscaria (strain Koide BX008) TaxID=946122 RepID=A0A0C2WM33_AMAMK|nr:hypothetical protein M378DRAFT_12694 [Amanita muscaria Koide BX008]